MNAKYRLALQTPHQRPRPAIWTPSRSYVQQFLQILHIHAELTPGGANVRDMTNVLRNVVANSVNVEYWLEGDLANEWYGPIVGSGVGAEAPTDYKLDTPIAHGGGAGELSYPAGSIGALTIDGASVYFDVIRALTNLSGGDVTVREVGLTSATQGWYFLLIRDVIPTPIVIPNNGILTLTYRILTTN